MRPSAAIQSGFIFLLYLVLRVAGFPLLVLYFLRRGWRDPRYLHRFGERLGRLPASFKRTPSGSIWLHAVSVGEAMSAARLAGELRKTAPGLPIYLSTTTMAGRAIATQRAAGLVDGIFYAPLDYRFSVRAVIRALRPAVVVILETEIWPVLYKEAKRAGCGLVLLNGRISDRALPRYERFRWAFGPVLALVDAIFVQSERDRERYIGVGAPAETVTVGGNLKYDVAPSQAAPPEFVSKLVASLRPDAVWIAASTMPGVDSADLDEDDAVIQASRELARYHPRLLTILVPRRPERFASAAAKLNAAGLRFVRRSAEEVPETCEPPCVLLLDSIGELASVFPLADVVFMGGTLARRGGHNVLEPAMCAKPIVVGPHMENFSDIAEDFRSGHGWLEIAGADKLAGAVGRLLNDAELRDRLGRRASTLALKNTGAAARGAAEILRVFDNAVPVTGRLGILWPLARLWQAGSGLKQRRDLAHARSLRTPVISVGGIAMGGTGKTPFVELLARRLAERGLGPAILTRGYRRASKANLVVAAGGRASLSDTGDEAQIFVRSGIAHVGVGADRFIIGEVLEQQLHPGVFLLDDGFQHRRLRRDLDIVLIDSLDPFPGGDVFPAGRMREGVRALARADMFVITRAQSGRNYEGIRAMLRGVNPKAPVFLARVQARRWMPSEPPAGPVAAFCGLGNPDAFWITLSELGLDPVHRWTFADHHRYTPQELARLRGEWTLLTTEKDAMNLPENSQGIFWLKIETVLENENEFMERLPLK